MKFNFEDENDN
jgi:protein KRI1